MEVRLLRFTLFVIILKAGNVSALNCTSSQFQCDNGKCIDLASLCDFTDDCGDNSDEIRHVTGFKCPMGRKRNVCVLTQRYVNDTVAHCADRSDLCVREGIETCHKCLTTNTLLAGTQLCDGVIDCPDASDECLCEVTTAANLCARLVPGQLISCDNNTKTLPLSRICDGILDCVDSIDELHCRLAQSNQVMSCPSDSNNRSIILALVCDGRPECYDFSDECDSRCQGLPEYCAIARNNSISNASIFSCPSGNGNLTIPTVAVCDGIWTNCTNRILVEERACSSRYYCTVGNDSLISIHASRVCNGIVDCDDGSDEVNCTSRFYCESGHPLSVPESYLLDGQGDCTDASDECPSFLDLRLYSSRHHLSSNLGITVWLWIMAVVGFVGNSIVFVYTLRKLVSGNLQTSISRANHILVLNLNLADGMTSIYLLFVGAKIIEYSGIYCFVDLWWRTSFACTFMGSFSIFAAESSLFVLTIMTSQRLYSVYDPIDARSIKVTRIGIVLLLAWLLSALIAAVPSMAPSVFVERYWIESKYFKSELLRIPHFHAFLRNLLLLAEPANSTALLPNLDFRTYLQDQHPQFQILGDFGFYSENSVCIPHFYVPLGDNGWFYPTTIVTINLFAFVYVAIAYWIIYRYSINKTLQTTQTSKNAKLMQKRIAKLVAVNFAVWLPICVASYVQLGIAKEFSDNLYVITAVFLFPINSVVNPLLYSDVFERLWHKLTSLYKRAFKTQKVDITTQNPTGETNL